ncbi:unnamed protein product [Cunninghamella echinulata]
MIIPKEYPDQPAKIAILDQDIPRAFAINLERGFDEYVSTVKTTLVRQLAWLDRNLEQLLTKPPATTPTVRFVSHKTTQVAPALPDHFIKAATTAAVKPSTSSAPPNKVQKENNITEKENNTNLKHSSSITDVTNITTATKTTSSSSPSNKFIQSFTATDEELAAAFGRRSREINHLSARLGKSFKMSKSDRSLLFVSMTLNDPGFTHFNFFDDNILKLRYHVPLQYPIASCYIEIENKNIGNDIQNHIIHEFNYHTKLCPDYTLFEHLNWLHRHMESILNKPPPVDLTNPTTPLLRQIRSPPTNTNHINPSKSISTKAKQNVSIFKDDQVKKKIIIVNDPNFTSPHTVITNEASSSNSNNNRESIESTNHNENTDSTMISTSEEEEEEEAKVNKPLNVSEQLTVRRGTEIRLMKPQLDNITFFRCTSLYLLVKCNRCKSTIDIENLLPIESDFDNNHNDDNKGKVIAKKNERITSCSTCHSIIGIKFYSELIHHNSPSLGLLQLSGCKAFDMLTSTFMGSCESCFEDLNHTLRLAPFERPITVPCYACHTKMTIALNEYKFIHIGEDGQSFQIQPEVATMKLKKKIKIKKNHLQWASHYQMKEHALIIPNQRDGFDLLVVVNCILVMSVMIKKKIILMKWLLVIFVDYVLKNKMLLEINHVNYVVMNLINLIIKVHSGMEEKVFVINL